jgi:hypothetical protein
MPSAKIYLIWQHVSTSKSHLQARSIKYKRVKGNMYNFIKSGIETLMLPYDKVHVAVSTQLSNIKINVVKKLFCFFFEG